MPMGGIESEAIEGIVQDDRANHRDRSIFEDESEKRSISLGESLAPEEYRGIEKNRMRVHFV